MIDAQIGDVVVDLQPGLHGGLGHPWGEGRAAGRTLPAITQAKGAAGCFSRTQPGQGRGLVCNLGNQVAPAQPGLVGGLTGKGLAHHQPPGSLAYPDPYPGGRGPQAGPIALVIDELISRDQDRKRIGNIPHNALDNLFGFIKTAAAAFGSAEPVEFRLVLPPQFPEGGTLAGPL